MLYVSRGWWMADLALDPELPNELEVGQPVSVGLSYLRIGSGDPYLREVSIVSAGAIAGAEVTRRSELAAPKPAPLTPGRAPVAAAAPVIHRTPSSERAAAEIQELRRRQMWLEEHGYRADFEDVLDNLKQELGYGRDLSREWRRRRTAA